MDDDSKTVESLGINENDAILIEGKKPRSYERRSSFLQQYSMVSYMRALFVRSRG